MWGNMLSVNVKDANLAEKEKHWSVEGWIG